MPETPPHSPSDAFLSQAGADMAKQLRDPSSGAVTEALTRRCDLCNAKPGEHCTNPIRPNHPLPGGRLIHYGRRLPA